MSDEPVYRTAPATPGLLIMKNYHKEYIFFHLNIGSWDFQPLLEQANPTMIDSFFLDNPNPLLRNVSAQLFTVVLS